MKTSVFVMLLILMLTGCVKIDIGDHVREATLGDKLVDLIAAKNTGVINEIEFADLKRKLLESI